MWGWMKTSSETGDRVTAKSDTIIWFWFQLRKSCRKQNPNEQNDTLIRADNQNNLPMNMHSLTELRFCFLFPFSPSSWPYLEDPTVVCTGWICSRSQAWGEGKKMVTNVYENHRNFSNTCIILNVTTTNGIWPSKNPLFEPIPLLIVQLAFIITITRSLYFILRPLRQPRLVTDILVSKTVPSNLFHFY